MAPNGSVAATKEDSMTTPSDINYPLAEEQIADAMIESFRGTTEHNLCVFRINNDDHPHLNYQRIAQRIQDSMQEEVSWREVPKAEVALSSGEDIGDDHIIVFKRDEMHIEVPEEND